jgi:ankyrin repeat protein
VIELLVGNGANLEALPSEGQTLLQYAVQFGSAETLKCLVELGADVNTATHPHMVLRSALHAKGGDLEIRDSEGHAPLAFAVLEVHLAAIEWLVGKGANIAADDQGCKPIHHAANSIPVKYLAKMGACINARTIQVHPSSSAILPWQSQSLSKWHHGHRHRL